MLLTILSIPMMAQTGSVQKSYLYYQISTKEALELLQKKDFDPAPEYFHTPITAADYQQQNKNGLIHGNYLRVNNQLNNLNITLLLQTTAKVDIIHAKKYLYFNPVNIPASERASAQIWLNGKSLAWHEPTQHFRWKKKKRKKKLKMVARIGDQLIHQTLEQKENYKYRPGLWYRINPVRWVKNVSSDIVNVIEKIKDPDYGGYMVLNQPEYRPGDTLKMKAYFVDKKGNFPEGPLRMMPPNFNYQTKNYIELYPDEEGNITHEMVLHDSLEMKLNRGYSLRFKNRHLNNFSNYFQFKDYQLDEVDYKLTSQKWTYDYRDTVKITASALYKNGLRVKDARVKITLLPAKDYVRRANVSSFFEDQVTLRDTLWQWEQPLNILQPTEIIIPDSILPAANFSYRVVAVFTNANGEIQTKQANFNLWKNTKPATTDCFSVSMEGMELLVENNCPDRPDLRRVTMREMRDYRLNEKIIALPHREKIGSQHYSWRFFDTDSVLVQTFDLSKEYPNVSITGEHAGDSVLVEVRNPRGLEILWEWYADKQLETAATAIPAGNFFNRKADRNKTYYLKYFYKWNGQIQQENRAFKFYENKLNMQVVQPKIIKPGATVAVKVKVTDGDGKDAKNVNLTALSINDQFKNSRVNGPRIKVGPFKKPKEKPDYRTISTNLETHKKIDKDWLKKLGLSEDLYYKIRFPDRALFLHYEKIEGDSFYQDIAQFAPYIVRDGTTEPVLMIKVNRKLVYYFDVDDQQPYSFIGSPGKNNITIRTRNHEYTVNGVTLKRGQKLELSIDAERMKKIKKSGKISRKKMPDTWTAAELNLIKQSIFILKNHRQNWSEKTAFTQGNQRIHFVDSRDTYIKLGPFENRTIDFYPPPNRSLRGNENEPVNLRFDPEFSYEILPGRDRLYEYKFSNKISRKVPPNYQPLALVYTPEDLRKFNWRTIAGEVRTSPVNHGNSTAIFGISNPKEVRLTILKRADKLYIFLPGFIPKFQNLKAGDYQLSVLYFDGSQLEHNFSVAKKTLVFHNLTGKTLTPDPSQSKLKELMKAYPEYFNISLADLPKKLQEEKTIPDQHFVPVFFGIRGSVQENGTGEGLIGATIQIKKLGIGTVTDFDGEFKLEAPVGVYDITVSYIGFNSVTIQNVSIPSNKWLDVKMANNSMSLDEVVVVGYGSSKKKRQKTFKARYNKISDVKIRGARSATDSYYSDVASDESAILPEVENQPHQHSDFTDDATALRSQFADYAYFQPRLRTDQNGEAFFQVTYPDNTTRWNNFVIGMNRKKQAGIHQSTTDAYKKVMARLAAPRFLIAGDQVDLIGKSLNYSENKFLTNTKFTLNNQTIQSNQFNLEEVAIEKALLTAPPSDSITFTYELSSPDFQDGEQRSIPVLPVGVEETSGIYKLLVQDTTITASFDPARGPVYIRAEINPVSVAAAGLKYLRHYRHECNEQAASKLLAFLWSEKLGITTNREVDYSKQIKRLIRLLENRQHPVGHWSWWQTGDPNYWMTFHVIKVLSFAKENGYTTKALEPALTWMTNETENLNAPQRLHWLALMTDIGQQTDFEKWLQPLDADWTGKTIYDTLLIAKVKQAAGLPFDLDVLKSKMEKTLLGDYYFGYVATKGWMSGSDLQATLLAFQIFSDAGADKIAEGLRRYILRNRKQRYWINTITTARIIHTLLLNDFEADGKIKRQAQLSINGTDWQNITDTIFQINDVFESPVTFQKRGNATLYLTAYQKFYNPDPLPKTDIFALNTEFIQDKKTVTRLQAGEKTQLKTTVKVDGLAEYAVIEIPVPAACSYGEQTNNWRNRLPYESHREYFKDRIAIYCRRLPAGTHTFTVDLEPGFTGAFTMNPATAEMMYFPTFSGRNGLRKVEVWE